MAGTPFAATVRMPHRVETVFGYLADPRHRPEWQASLRSVALADPDGPRVGTTWRETTLIGVRPRLEITELSPYRRWAERGRWYGVSATLVLDFTPTVGGCQVEASGEVTGAGAWALPAGLAGRLAGRAVAGDLHRAARVLSRRGARG